MPENDHNCECSVCAERYVKLRAFESGNYVHIDNVAHHLDDIEVDANGKCAWTDIANALTYIRLCRVYKFDDR